MSSNNTLINKKTTFWKYIQLFKQAQNPMGKKKKNNNNYKN